VLLGVYRTESQVVSSAFFKELATMFERLPVYSCPVVICGDSNMHVDDASCADAVRLADLLQSFGDVQHVTTATHTAGHTFDLVIARTDTDITDVDVGGFISDHVLVRFTIVCGDRSTRRNQSVVEPGKDTRNMCLHVA